MMSSRILVNHIYTVMFFALVGYVTYIAFNAGNVLNILAWTIVSAIGVSLGAVVYTAVYMTVEILREMNTIASRLETGKG